MMNQANLPPFRLISNLGFSGFGLQILQGISRYQSLHSGLLMSSCSIPQLRNFPDDNDIVGAIGHFFYDDHYDALGKKGIERIVTVSNRRDEMPVPCTQHLLIDDLAVGQMAASYFLRKGFRQFALVGIRSEDNFRFADLRSEGYLNALREAGYPHVLQFTTQELVDLDARSLPAPLAMFVVSDANAANAMDRLIRNGGSIPRDIAVLGVDNDERIVPFSPVPLSSIKLPLEKVGYDACEELYKRILGNEEYDPIRLYSPIKVVERLSTGDMTADDQYIRKAQSMIEENLPDIRDVQHLSELLHTSRRTLDRKFHRHIGQSAASWLNVRRVHYTLRLLRETDHSVDRIAELAGFGSRQTLYEALKRANQPMPKEYRSRHRISDADSD